MKNWNKVMQHTTFRYIDHTLKTTFNDVPYTALNSFAIDDALTLSVSNQLSPPTIRSWVHDKTVVLGIPDARLPFIEEGVAFLNHHGYEAVVRNSGGLAVALDKGVLNLSLIIPHVKHISIHDGYEAMYDFVKQMFHDLTDQIEAYEIVGSYCPGDYDLSIDGIKFAGISQRRIKDGAAVQIYLDIEGNSYERAHMIQTFYNLAKRDEHTKFSYPDVIPEKMGSLSQLLNKQVTVEHVKQRAQQTLSSYGNLQKNQSFSDQELKTYERRLEQMIKRNEKISNC